MVNYSKVERVFMVTEYIRTQSYQRVRPDFAVGFPDSDPSLKCYIITTRNFCKKVSF